MSANDIENFRVPNNIPPPYKRVGPDWKYWVELGPAAGPPPAIIPGTVIGLEDGIVKVPPPYVPADSKSDGGSLPYDDPDADSFDPMTTAPVPMAVDSAAADQGDILAFIAEDDVDPDVTMAASAESASKNKPLEQKQPVPVALAIKPDAPTALPSAATTVMPRHNRAKSKSPDREKARKEKAQPPKPLPAHRRDDRSRSPGARRPHRSEDRSRSPPSRKEKVVNAHAPASAAAASAAGAPLPVPVTVHFEVMMDTEEDRKTKPDSKAPVVHTPIIVALKPKSSRIRTVAFSDEAAAKRPAPASDGDSIEWFLTQIISDSSDSIAARDRLFALSYNEGKYALPLAAPNPQGTVGPYQNTCRELAAQGKAIIIDTMSITHLSKFAERSFDFIYKLDELVSPLFNNTAGMTVASWRGLSKQVFDLFTKPVEVGSVPHGSNLAAAAAAAAPNAHADKKHAFSRAFLPGLSVVEELCEQYRLSPLVAMNYISIVHTIPEVRRAGHRILIPRFSNFRNRFPNGEPDAFQPHIYDRLVLPLLFKYLVRGIDVRAVGFLTSAVPTLAYDDANCLMNAYNTAKQLRLPPVAPSNVVVFTKIKFPPRMTPFLRMEFKPNATQTLQFFSNIPKKLSDKPLDKKTRDRESRLAVQYEQPSAEAAAAAAAPDAAAYAPADDAVPDDFANLVMSDINNIITETAAAAAGQPPAKAMDT